MQDLYRTENLTNRKIGFSISVRNCLPNIQIRTNISRTLNLRPVFCTVINTTRIHTYQ
jgi:hypothetical protein